MVQVFKSVESTSRSKEPKITPIYNAENYKEALRKVELLTQKNKNWRVTYFTGNIYK